MEIEQIYQTIRNYDGHRWQLATFFGGVNFTAVALGLSVEKYGIVLLASILLLLVFIGDLMLKATLAIPLYRAFKLDSFYAADKISFFRIYVAVHTRGHHRAEFLSEMDQIISLTDPIEVSQRLRKLFSKPFLIRTGVARIAIIGILIEITLGVVLALLGWPAF